MKYEAAMKNKIQITHLYAVNFAFVWASICLVMSLPYSLYMLVIEGSTLGLLSPIIVGVSALIGGLFCALIINIVLARIPIEIAAVILPAGAETGRDPVKERFASTKTCQSCGFALNPDEKKCPACEASV